VPGRAVVWVKAGLHLACALLLVYLLWIYRSGALAADADPVNFITHFTGDWALWLLLADLAITPVRRLSPKLSWLIRLRRMVGLWAFFYATLHLLTYVFLFSGYDVPTAMEGLRAGHLAEPWRQLKLIWPAMLDDVKKRRFIQVGLGAWTILLALAVTSPLRVLRAMGGKNWQRLHRLIYVAGWLAITHYWWQVKKGVQTPWKVTVVLVVLLLARVVWWVWRRMKGSKTLAATGA
jgi:sulfoxide reductase heme-binding subunit YedZ